MVVALTEKLPNVRAVIYDMLTIYADLAII